MRQHSFINIILATIILTSGCTSGKYKPFKLSEELHADQSVWQNNRIDQNWWRQYHNPTLNRLIDEALANNPDYIKAAININKELYRLNLSTSDFFPTLSGSLSASGQRRIDTSDRFSSNFSGELGLNYELDLFGKIRAEHSAQRFELQATVMDKESARLSLINSVTDLYFNLEYLQNSIDLTKKNIQAYQNIEQITAGKFYGGHSDNLEYLQAKQSVLTEQNTLLRLETQFKEMENSLKNILNTADEKFVENIEYGDILDQKNPGINLNVPLAVLARRPDLLASQYRLQKAFKNLQAEERNWYPDITLKGVLGSNSDKARTTFEFPFIIGNVGINLPFLDWNRVKNNVKISQADYQIAAVDFKDTLTQAVNEVAFYNYAYQKSLDSYTNIETNYQNAIKITAYYAARYNNGKIEFRDYLDAINRENALRKDLAAEKYNIIKYENYICKAMGGRVETLDQ